MKILVKFPTFGRPKQFFETLYKYYKLADDHKNMEFIVTIDQNDTTMNNTDVLNGLKTYPNLHVNLGLSNNKIHAINRDLDLYTTNWDILLLASDDMVPQIKSYDKIIRDDMLKYYDNLDGVLWYNDGFQSDKLNTLSIMGRVYYERFKYIYYPEYKSVYADNEFTEVSTLLNKATYQNNILIKHHHPDYGFNRQDIVHIKNFENLKHDQDLFNKRKQNNFYI